MSTQILMPALSPTMEEGKLAKWHVKEGDTVKAGDVLAEIETDKATMEFEAIDEGRIGKLLVPEGAEGVKVNAPIALLLEEGETAPKAPALSNIPDAMKAIREALAPGSPPKAEKATPQQPAQPAPTAATPPPAPQPPPMRTNGRIFASPLAKRIAQQKGLDLASLKGSGPHGRIVKADVEAARTGASAQSGQRPIVPVPTGAVPQRRKEEAPAAGTSIIAPLPDARLFYKEGDYEAVPHDSMRRTIARRLTSAKALIPHYYLTIDCDIRELMDARARLNARAPKEGPEAYKLSVNDFVIKAAAMALMKHPDVNASWSENALLKHKHADIGIAVDLNPGLITPIVFHAETRGLLDISREARSLAERAKEKKLKPQEFEGGTFSISNLGMFGMKQFTAVINPPQSAILAIGAGEEHAVVKDGKITVAQVMSVTMGCDHRVIDGATGARFLQTFKAFIEEPAAMLL
ncbi:MAG TPA: pyruvate dehydrogenase complex dihydrolipoamide acetyltransferase [Micropepsaceae bacterium]|nr:pyruvate dehydrogenase complex dihydrolipoamide acetyltransferase [Micropepsaceae bacterium]